METPREEDHLGPFGCYNKIPVFKTGWLKNKRHLLLTVLEAGSPRSGYQHGQVRALFWVRLLCPHMVEGAKELCEISFTRELILSTKALPS